jgi:hypothetical protein
LCKYYFHINIVIGLSSLLDSTSMSDKMQSDVLKRVSDTKHLLRINFEQSMEDLALYIEMHEKEAWKGFYETFAEMAALAPFSREAAAESPPPSFLSSPEMSPASPNGRKNRRFSVSPLQEGDVTRRLMRSRSSAEMAASSLSAAKSRLTKRLELIKQQRVHQENFEFITDVIHQFRLLMFEFKVQERMVAYMDTEQDVMEKKLRKMEVQNMDKLMQRHGKEKAKAIADAVSDDVTNKLLTKQEAQVKKLGVKIEERVRYKEQQFLESRTRTMEKLEAKMKEHREEMSQSVLSPQAMRAFKNILRVYSMIKATKVY